MIDKAYILDENEQKKIITIKNALRMERLQKIKNADYRCIGCHIKLEAVYTHKPLNKYITEKKKAPHFRKGKRLYHALGCEYDNASSTVNKKTDRKNGSFSDYVDRHIDKNNPNREIYFDGKYRNVDNSINLETVKVDELTDYNHKDIFYGIAIVTKKIDRGEIVFIVSFPFGNLGGEKKNYISAYLTEEDFLFNLEEEEFNKWFDIETGNYKIKNGKEKEKHVYLCYIYSKPYINIKENEDGTTKTYYNFNTKDDYSICFRYCNIDFRQRKV